MPARQAGRGREQRDAPADTAVPRGQSGCSNGGPGQTDPPGWWDRGCRWGLPGPPGSSNNRGLPPSAEVQVSEPPQLCPFGSGASPPGRGGHNKALQLGAGPRGRGISLQPAGPASVLGNGAPGDWEGGLELPRGPGRGLRAAGGLQPLALSLPTGLPFPKPCPRLPFPGGTGCVPPKASLQPSGIGAPQNVLLPKRAQQHPAPRGDVLGRFVPPASPARRDEADPGRWKSPDSGEDNSRQGERGKKKSPLQFSAGFCLT